MFISLQFCLVGYVDEESSNTRDHTMGRTRDHIVGNMYQVWKLQDINTIAQLKLPGSHLKTHLFCVILFYAMCR